MGWGIVKCMHRFYMSSTIQCMPRWVRFALSGITTAIIQLAVLYLLADILLIHYLVASTVAFVIAIVTNFILQKHWTFEDKGRDGMASKFAIFCSIAVGNLALNTVGMYLLVDVLGVWHMLAQCVMMSVLAVMNYLLYGLFVFRAR